MLRSPSRTYLGKSPSSAATDHSPFPLAGSTSPGKVDLVAVNEAGPSLPGLHEGALVGEGEVDGQDVVRRNHRWRFDRATARVEEVRGPR